MSTLKLATVVFAVVLLTGCNKDNAPSSMGTGSMTTSSLARSSSGLAGAGSSSSGSSMGAAIAEVHNPEPGTLLLLGFGAGAIALKKLRSKRTSKVA